MTVGVYIKAVLVLVRTSDTGVPQVLLSSSALLGPGEMSILVRASSPPGAGGERGTSITGGANTTTYTTGVPNKLI